MEMIAQAVSLGGQFHEKTFLHLRYITKNKKAVKPLKIKDFTAMSVTGIEDLHHSETRMEWAFQSFEAKVSSKVSSDRSIGISKKGGMPQ